MANTVDSDETAHYEASGSRVFTTLVIIVFGTLRVLNIFLER